jgi:hypothetical protein
MAKIDVYCTGYRPRRVEAAYVRHLRTGRTNEGLGYSHPDRPGSDTLDVDLYRHRSGVELHAATPTSDCRVRAVAFVGPEEAVRLGMTRRDAVGAAE